MKKKTKKEVLVNLLPDLTYYSKQGNFKRKVSMGRFIPDAVNYPNNKELSPAKIYDELDKLRLKENADDAGLMEIRSLIKDERKFVRLHQTWETKNLFENFMTIRSAHLLAYILDFIQIDKKNNLNVITFDKNILWKKQWKPMFRNTGRRNMTGFRQKVRRNKWRTSVIVLCGQSV